MRVKGQIVGVAGLSRVTGRPRKTVEDWIRRGLPVLKRGSQGQKWEIDTAAAIDWICEQRAGIAARVIPPVGGDELNGHGPERLDLTTERARESKERADKYALENAQSRRELIPVEDVLELWGRMQSAAKRQFRGVAVRAKTSGVLPDLTLEQSAGLLRLIDESLEELSGDGVPDSNGSGCESLDEVSTPMGSAA